MRYINSRFTYLLTYFRWESIVIKVMTNHCVTRSTIGLYNNSRASCKVSQSRAVRRRRRHAAAAAGYNGPARRRAAADEQES